MEMTTNELANKLEEYNNDGFPVLVVEQAATMLRQQAKELDEAGHMIGVLREYISDLEKGLDSSIKLNKAQAERQVKELTDEEIVNLYKETEADNGGIREFARAILRKAQEK
jgi:hypothetical protein